MNEAAAILTEHGLTWAVGAPQQGHGSSPRVQEVCPEAPKSPAWYSSGVKHCAFTDSSACLSATY